MWWTARGKGTLASTYRMRWELLGPHYEDMLPGVLCWLAHIPVNAWD